MQTLWIKLWIVYELFYHTLEAFFYELGQNGTGEKEGQIL